MADKRKEGTGQPKRTVVRRRRTTGGAAGRLAVRRDTAAYSRTALDEHAVQVREQIEAALAEARRVREDITQRIDRRLHEEDEGKAGKLITKLTAKARLRAVKPLGPELRGKGEDSSRPRPSK
ncbi:hypothetical protein [Vitiosangium sp. GDMCC 1.1324]|uniref:hypothetical protein n=1 Tax=Vitiosangium sp. (strain GDMCC 1.1324) TaxID=2138576 RepID=UPI000D3D8D19|nr:hypothetical protein [Vitiosangium sp. GDMCC 1.1324]PTL84877.1 hypothetical protein DAT35_07430 [Vitiosangium sp. GDMCC 1.1324]